jgi:hypothetical protein
MYLTKSPAPFRKVALLVGTLLIFNVAVAGAQSGRRLPKRPTTADPTQPKENEPPVTKPEEKKSDKPAIPILLAKHDYDMMYSSDVYLNVVMSGFLERVAKMQNIKVDPGGRDTNRKEAYDAAKASPDRYVVWFQLVPDSMTSSQSDYYSYVYNMYIDYVVFTPGTGKTKTSGHVYQRSRGAGPVSVPVPGRGGVEYSLRYAGMELADRVLSTLDQVSTTTTPTTH